MHKEKVLIRAYCLLTQQLHRFFISAVSHFYIDIDHNGRITYITNTHASTDIQEVDCMKHKWENSILSADNETGFHFIALINLINSLRDLFVCLFACSNFEPFTLMNNDEC